MSTTNRPERKSILNPLSEIGLNTPKRLDALYPDSPPLRMMPDVNVIKIGGQSFLDRGREAVFPIRAEIAEAAKKHKLLIGMGGGTRARHAYSVALDLDLPTGLLATIGQATAVQNQSGLGWSGPRSRAFSASPELRAQAGIRYWATMRKINTGPKKTQSREKPL